MGIIVLDIETTGTNKLTDEILQVSIINGSGKVLFNKYIKPKRATSWSGAEAVNHISPKSVSQCKTIDHYIKKIQRIINRADIIVGYNHEDFDCPFLENAGISFSGKKMVDVFLEHRDKYYKKYSKWPKLTQVARDYGYIFVPHDSLEDCKATLHIYNKTHSGSVDKTENGNNTVGRITAMTRTIITFAAGLTLNIVLSRYLQETQGLNLSLYVAILISGFLCYRSNLVLGVVTGPIGYLAFQVLFGHQRGILYLFAVTFLLSILLKLVFGVVKRAGGGVLSLIIGLIGMFLVIAGLFWLLKHIGSISAGKVAVAHLQGMKDLSLLGLLAVEAEFVVNWLLDRFSKY